MKLALPEKNWLSAFQAQELEKFHARGFPTRKDEKWKYTDVSALVKKLKANDSVMASDLNQTPALPRPAFDNIHLVFRDGCFDAALSDLRLLPKEVIACPLNQGLQVHENLIQSYLTQQYDITHHPFACLNASMMTNGFFLWVPPQLTLSIPIRYTFINTQNKTNSFPRNILIAAKNSAVTVIEEHLGTGDHYFTNVLTQVIAEENAQIQFYKVQKEAATATHFSTIFIQQKQNSVVNGFSLSLGSHLAREEINATAEGKNAECQLNGFYYLTSNQQQSDHYLHIDHQASFTKSAMVYKGILNKKSRAVFNGKVLVRKEVNHINAHQENHNLLLSAESEINTKPELEIYADDVSCTHGATVGQLDKEALFYLRSRGIEDKEAYALLQQAFAEDFYTGICCQVIRDYFRELSQ